MPYISSSTKIKRTITLFTLAGIILLTSCAKKQTDNHQNIAPPSLPAKEEVTISQTVPPSASPSDTPSPTLEAGLPNVIGLYINDNGTRKLVANEFASVWTQGQDIKCFEAIAADRETISGNGFAVIWNAEWNKYENTGSVKIGYSLTIKLKTGKEITYDIKTPSDTQQNRDYIETYLYDDVHQTPGQWYSHLEENAITEETVATSIKLTAGNKISDVENIILTAYLYTADKPDRIIVSYTINVKQM